VLFCSSGASYLHIVSVLKMTALGLIGSVLCLFAIASAEHAGMLGIVVVQFLWAKAIAIQCSSSWLYCYIVLFLLAIIIAQFILAV